MSTTEKANRYSLSLTRYCFIHRDYMDIYMNELPSTILDQVAANFNCEDVAMTLLISSLTQGKPPLLADVWAVKSMIKLYVEKKISGTRDHKALRDQCVDSFANMLGLKDNDGSKKRLKASTLYHKSNRFFECGDELHHPIERKPKCERQSALEEKLKHWQSSKSMLQKELQGLMSATGKKAYSQGLIADTDRWNDRFKGKKRHTTRNG